jgi:hypothetical protein
MICNNCGKDFHYCPSRGYFPEAKYSCCSKKCVEAYINKLGEAELIEVWLLTYTENV